MRRRFAPQLNVQLFSTFLLLFLISDSNGQAIIPRTARQDIQNRDWPVFDVRLKSDVIAQRERLVSQLAVQADFRKLQLVDIELLKQVLNKENGKQISTSLAQIKKLATRLRTSFCIPTIAIDDGAKRPAEIALAPGVILLDKFITSFLENALFQQPKVFDSELASRAATDVANIVRLCDFLSALTKKKPNDRRGSELITERQPLSKL